MFVEMGRVSTQLAVMEWHSVSMAAMNSDVNDNQDVRLPNFNAPLAPPQATVTTIDINASLPVVDVMEGPTAQMEAMNEVVQHIVSIAEHLVLALAAPARGDVMEVPSAMMEAMKKTAIIQV
jgi:hypothetical protein